eukprot:4598894-Pleurochrysis_carterae.AAC.1
MVSDTGESAMQLKVGHVVQLPGDLERQRRVSSSVCTKLQRVSAQGQEKRKNCKGKRGEPAARKRKGGVQYRGRTTQREYAEG